jgi:hypothetical protein
VSIFISVFGSQHRDKDRSMLLDNRIQRLELRFSGTLKTERCENVQKRPLVITAQLSSWVLLTSVSIVSGYGLDMTGRSGFGPWQMQKNFSSSLCVQTSSGAHPASCTMGNGGPFPEVKAWLRHDADHSPPSSTEVKNE